MRGSSQSEFLVKTLKFSRRQRPMVPLLQEFQNLLTILRMVHDGLHSLRLYSRPSRLGIEQLEEIPVIGFPGRSYSVLGHVTFECSDCGFPSEIVT
jgi:hypothetical protein